MPYNMQMLRNKMLDPSFPRKRSPNVKYPDFDVCMGQLINYKRQFKTLFVPTDYVSPNGVELGKWYLFIRNKFREGKLPRHQISALRRVGITHSPLAARFEAGCQVLKRYLEIHPGRYIPDSVEFEGFALGRWFSNYVSHKRNGTLKPSHAKIFKSFGVVWEPADVFTIGCARLAAFRRKYGHTRVLLGFVDPTGFHLYNWTRVQRQLLKNGQLSSEQVAKLKRAGVSTGVLDEVYTSHIAIALRYKAANGCETIPTNAIFENVSIGQWVSQANFRYRRGKIAEPFATALKTAGLLQGRTRPNAACTASVPTARARERAFEEGLRHLQDFKTEYGHVNVIERRMPGEGFNLGRWLNRRKRTSREGTLPEYQRRELAALGVILAR